MGERGLPGGDVGCVAIWVKRLEGCEVGIECGKTWFTAEELSMTSSSSLSSEAEPVVGMVGLSVTYLWNCGSSWSR